MYCGTTYIERTHWEKDRKPKRSRINLQNVPRMKHSPGALLKVRARGASLSVLRIGNQRQLLEATSDSDYERYFWWNVPFPYPHRCPTGNRHYGNWR